RHYGDYLIIIDLHITSLFHIVLVISFIFFFIAPPTPTIYTLSLHDALPISQAVLGDAAEVIALLQAVDPVLDRGCAPELPLDDTCGLLELALVPQLGEHDVPRGQRHDEQQHQHGAGDDVAGRPERRETIRVVG